MPKVSQRPMDRLTQQMIALEIEGHSPVMSGTLVFREAVVDNANIVPEGKKIMLVFGSVLVPENFALPSDSHVRVRGFADQNTVAIFTDPAGGKLDAKYAGWTVNDLFTQPIWKLG